MRVTARFLPACLVASSALAWCGVALSHRAGGQESGNPQSLFNGKDLTGWVTPDDKAIFSVENGEIGGRTRGDLRKNEFLVTEKPYRDFVLEAKVKFKNGNSGIQFRSKRAADGAVSGPQADVANGYWGLLYEERGRGILERYPEDKAKELVKNDDWNDFVITAKGKHVTIDFNGTRIIDRTDEKFADEGVIALQVHVGPPMEVRFKDIEITELENCGLGPPKRSGSCPGSIDFVRLPRNRSPLRASGSYPRASSAKPGETHLNSTFAVFWGFPEVGLLAEMVGIGQVPHLAQGGYHAHYNRPYPQAVVPETTPQPVPCISTPTGSKSSCVSAADRSDSRPTAQTGPYYL